MELLPHQRKVVDFFKNDVHKGLILVHSTGTGKTLTALSVASEKKIKCVIICTKNGESIFKRDIQNFRLKLDPIFYTYRNILSLYDKKNINDIMAGSPLLIIDEAHILRNKTKQTYAILECAKYASYVLLLTASPILNDESDLRNLVMAAYGITDLPKRFNVFQSNLYSFYQRNSLDENFPLCVEHNIELYSNDEFLVTQKQNESYMVYCNNMRRLIHKPKIDWTVKKIKENEKTVVFTNWKVNGLVSLSNKLTELNIDHLCITGEHQEKKRNEIINKFNNDEVIVLLFTSAVEEGINLIGVKNAIFLESGWNQHRARDRCIRYRSHAHLPPEERVLHCYNLILKTPNQESIDEILKTDYVHPKIDIYNDVIAKIKNVAI